MRKKKAAVEKKEETGKKPRRRNAEILELLREAAAGKANGGSSRGLGATIK